jgi:predicted nucleotide-binding protein
MLEEFAKVLEGPDVPIEVIRYAVAEGRRRAIAMLRQTVESLNEELTANTPDLPVVAVAAEPDPVPSRQVFIVHGHDTAAREEVARFVHKAGFEPIILHEQASSGKTVIEKLERYSDVGFVVVLMTPDDVGGVDRDHLQPRARQNVIAELFYFIGTLGRDRVCALKKGNVEIPSDIGGVVYVELDSGGAWKTQLLREVAYAGYEVEWEKALR